MKKISLMLVLLLLLASLAGCGGSDQPADTPDEEVVEGISETISVQVEGDWLEYYQMAADRVKEDHPDANIEFIVMQSFDHLDIIDSTSITNEDVADVFAISADRIYGLAGNQALAALDAETMAANIGGFGNFTEGLGGNFNVNGEYLAFPMNIETLINFANTSNAEARGINLEETIEFTELEAEDMLIPIFDAWFGIALVNSAEIELLGHDENGQLYSDVVKDFEELTEDQQALFTSLFEYWKAHRELNTPLFDENAAWGYMDANFETGGNASIRLEGPWSTNSLSNQAGNGEDLKILPINQVTVNGNELAHWKGGWGLVANARIEENEEKMLLAQKMIEEIVNPDYAIEFFKASGKILENVSADIYTNSDLPEIDKIVIAAVLESYENAPARPLFREWGEVWDTWKTAMLSWNAVNPTTAEEAYQQIQASFKAMMMNF